MSFAPVRELPQLHLQVQQSLQSTNTTPSSSKRSGLKPLHLPLSSTKTNSSPITSPTPEFSTSPVSPAVALSRSNSYKSDNRLRSPKSSRPATNRRLSSISYSPSPREGNSYSNPSPCRSNSVWAIPVSLVNDVAPEPSVVGPTNHTTPSPTVSLDPETIRPATELTLIEKHADLLHFIAQKESKCLELRSQLEQHEAELKALKAKWEKIVSRANRPSGTPRSRPSSMHSKSGSSIAPLANPDAMVEAIKDLGRYLGGYKIDDKASPKSHTAEDSFVSPSNASYTPNTEIHNAHRGASKRLSMISNSSSVSSTGTAVSSPPAQSTFQLNSSSSRPTSTHRRSNADHIASKVEAVPKTCLADDAEPLPEDAETRDGEDGERPENSSSRITLSASTVLGSASDWMLPVGLNKKWETIQGSDALAKSSKRASLLLADVTDISTSWIGSISSVLSPPPTATGSDLPHSDSTVLPARTKNPVTSGDKSHGTETLGIDLNTDPSENTTRKPVSTFAAKSAASREKRSPLAKSASLKVTSTRNVAPRRTIPASTGSDDEWADW